MGKQGNISQLGGDFIFGPSTVSSAGVSRSDSSCVDKELTFCSRMKHTEDRTWTFRFGLSIAYIVAIDVEISELMKEAGITL